MSVDVRRMVLTMGQSLVAGQLFRLATDYDQRTGFTLGTLLALAGQEWDRSAERLVSENGALRDLFSEATDPVADAVLRERLAEAATSADPGLRVSALQQRNDELRALLIELHTFVEAQPGEAARALEQRIWQELVASTERRQLEGTPF